MNTNSYEAKEDALRRMKRNLLIWGCALLVFAGILLYHHIEYRNHLYTADEIDARLCREIVVADIFELEEREVPLEEIEIINIEQIDDVVIAGYICSDNYATRYCDKGYLMFCPQEDGLYYAKKTLHEYNPYEMGWPSMYRDALGHTHSVSTALGREYISGKTYIVFLSDDPTLEKIYISRDNRFQQIEAELAIECAPYMYIMEMPEAKSLYITFETAKIEPGTHVTSFS